MQLNYNIIQKIPNLAILALALVLSSCGSYQYVGVDNDGIYNDTPTQNEKAVVEVPNETNNNYYKK